MLKTKYHNIWQHNAIQVLKMIKLKVVAVMMFASTTGMLIVPKTMLYPTKVLSGTIGIGLAACASAMLNHLFDRDEDTKMKRTHKRPLARKEMPPRTAWQVALLMIVCSSLLLVWANNTLCAYLTIATTIGYSIIYTRWLKPASPQNIVIGGLSGAMPPLLGWTSLTGSIDVEPLLLVLIIFAWTPAHFWPLAIAHAPDYAKTKWPMLPVTHGITFTKVSIIAYIWLTFAASCLPFCFNMAGPVYLCVTTCANILWLRHGWKLWQQSQHAMPAFQFSISYIFIIFGTLIVDHHLFLTTL